ncbi:PROTEIN CPR-5 [Salix purpurea]|uniref:PROTEIN CPR-5 n=1 Tax=Salix purpurea TaxID=77065 RepID=A0A9Q1AKT5_SALPP|nr:PROTEIN CPR-5 [Salix purpurea]
MYNNMEKSVVEQARSNDLKALEIGVAMKRLKLDEDLLNLTSESNYLERSKLVMGMSRASFKVDKFKTQLEDTRHAELHRKCIDCLVAGLFIMSASLSYSAYVYSYRRIKEATASCSLSHKGVQTRVVRRAVFILQFLAADTDVSSSSCEPDGVWDPDHSCSCILACTTFLNFKPDNANNFHSATAGSFLWFYRQTLCRYTGRERIALAPVLGSFMLAAVLVNCMHTDVVPRSSRARRRSLPGDKTRHNISILAPAITFLRYFPPFSTTVLWSFAICWPR